MNLFSSLLVLLACCRTSAYRIQVVKCNPGYRISSISKKSAKGTYGYAAECKPFVDDPKKIKDITCAFGTTSSCDGSLAGCKDHPDAWLGGVKIVPYELDTSIDLLIPLCCNASNVLVHGDKCRQSRMTSQGQQLSLETEQDEVIQGLSCRVSRTEAAGRVYDVMLKIRACRFELEKECCNKYMIGYFLHNFLKSKES
ncbi:hypothetical protein M514_03949 [Trichuris suis]|uniref:Uncharacterized protein n=1 Tax=Trichuris suis TaxID=68888 RepID=A0A085MDL2_9BILA|nr:hypothetical protein M513_03949 [Trichuris suis]KFD65898.1 hypothetical protein M514_03949 [Trichuris suis]KHJ45147.1 hypothetical protein D918_04451 [Trichuris suis]